MRANPDACVSGGPFRSYMVLPRRDGEQALRERVCDRRGIPGGLIENVSDQGVVVDSFHLDPDTNAKASNVAITATLIAIFSICLACIVLHLRGL